MGDNLMARIRTVKPELFRHELLHEAEQKSGLPLRLAYIGLFTSCDREGRFKWKPRALKLDVLPYDDLDFSRVLDALSTHGFIVKYEFEGDFFGCIPTWSQHQVINNRESASTLPSLMESTTCTHEARVNYASSTPLMHTQGEGKGKEGKGRGKEREREGASAEIVFPDGLDQMAWTRWVDYRKAAGKALRPVSWQSAIDALVKHGPNQMAVVEQSIANGWQGLFALKQGAVKATHADGTPLNKQETLEASNRAVVARFLAKEAQREAQ
jgi:hypothetical protein